MSKDDIKKAIVIFGVCLSVVGFSGLVLSMCQKDSHRPNTPAEEKRMQDLLK